LSFQTYWPFWEIKQYQVQLQYLGHIDCGGQIQELIFECYHYLLENCFLKISSAFAKEGLAMTIDYIDLRGLLFGCSDAWKNHCFSKLYFHSSKKFAFTFYFQRHLVLDGMKNSWLFINFAGFLIN
jgi:hypothetical protein